MGPTHGPLQSIEAEDEQGRIFDRRHDAEFKLLTGFCLTSGIPGTDQNEWEGSGELWSKKPLCRSCAGAVKQLEKRFPRLKLAVFVGDSEEDEAGSGGQGRELVFRGLAPC